MNKGIWLILTMLVITAALAAEMRLALAQSYYVLAEEKNLVMTNIGVLSFPAGTKIAGDFKNYATLSQYTTFKVEGEGMMTFPPGTAVDCDFEPGYPDPCGG